MHDITSLPISAITDGWVLKNGDLHLEVTCDDGNIHFVSIPVSRRQHRSKTRGETP